MKKIFVITAIILLGLQMTLIAAERLYLGTAEEFQGVVALNEDTLLPANSVLTYQDRTYVPLRDMADVFSYHVTWDEEKRGASVTREHYTRPMVEKPETALTIAKASVKWRYADKVTSDTAYVLHEVKEPDMITTTYWIYVFFDGRNVKIKKAEKEQWYAKQNADIAVAVDSVLGFVGIV